MRLNGWRLLTLIYHIINFSEICFVFRLEIIQHLNFSFRRVDRSADKCNCPLKKRDGILRSSSKHEDQWSEIIKLHSEREAREKLRFQPVCPGRYRNIDWLL